MVETVRDLIRNFNKGIAGVTNDSVGLFNYTINGLRQLMTNQENVGQYMPTNKIEDIKSMLKLQKQMIEGSVLFARLIV